MQNCALGIICPRNWPVVWNGRSRRPDIGLWTKFKKNLEHRRAKITKKRFTEVVGVDVGIRYLAVTSTSTGKAGFRSGKRARHQANHYARLRKRLQHKGRRFAKRRLRCIEQQERRFKVQANHTIASQIITQHPQALIGLEHLTDIRERTERKKRKRKKHGKGSGRTRARRGVCVRPERRSEPCRQRTAY